MENIAVLIYLRYSLIRCFLANGQWSMVNGQWSMVTGHWSIVNGQWSIETYFTNTRNAIKTAALISLIASLTH